MSAGRPIRDDAPYASLLGRYAPILEERIGDLVPGMLDKTSAWYRGQEKEVKEDPYGQLHEVGVRAEQRQLEYAAERVAVAAAAARLAVWEGEEPPTPTPAEMLENYRKDLGAERARRIHDEAARWYEGIVEHQDGEWVTTRSQQLADPYPPSEQLDEELARWAKDHLESAATLAALNRAERATVARAIEAERLKAEQVLLAREVEEEGLFF